MATADDYLEEAEAALRMYDRAKVAELCTAIIARTRQGEQIFSLGAAVRLLQRLRRKRHFELVQQVADAFLEYGPDAAEIRRQYAQALIESGTLFGAIAVLRALVAHDGVDAGERREARGLLGRAFKQLYVDAAPAVGEVQRRHLEEAIRWYAEVYAEEPAAASWHGINLVAILSRAARDAVALPESARQLDAQGIATEILARIEAGDRGAKRAAHGSRSVGAPSCEGSKVAESSTADAPPAAAELAHWDLATAAEACLALGRAAEATAWLQRYVEHRDVDAFELASTRRQLAEVWQLGRESTPGREIMRLLDAALLAAEGGGLVLAPSEVQLAVEELASAADGDQVRPAEAPPEGGTDGATNVGTAATGFPARPRAPAPVAASSTPALPRTPKPPTPALDGRRYKGLRWFGTALERARLVARISDQTGTAIGTGFLIRSAGLGIASEDDWLLLTNHHVLASSPKARGALRPEQARVRFEACSPVDALRVGEPIHESRLAPLDVTLVPLIGSLPRVGSYAIASALPDPALHERVWIVGHPCGGELAFSLHDNTVLDRDDRLLHYRAPTDPGSSGSPVWNERWELVAVHHAGGDRMLRLHGDFTFYTANEGVSLLAVRAALRGETRAAGA